MSDAAFDLIDRPWIPVLGPDGAQTLSLRDVVDRADRITAIGGELPTQGFALTRLLLAVLHRAVEGPVDRAHWAELWRRPGLPMGDVDDYLGRWRHRFDLFDPVAPFMQVADLHTAKGEFSGLEKIIADVPNGHAYFTTRSGTALRRIDATEAARWVVHAHAFDPSGIKSGAHDDGARVKGGKGYPIGIAWPGNLGGVLVQGPTLRDTLLLNLLPYTGSGRLQWGHREDDLPVWERAPLSGVVERPHGVPVGPADLYTWPSRRIRLIGGPDGVTAVLITNGDPLPVQDAFAFEPMTAWRRSEAQAKKLGRPLVYMPREHSLDRAFWRGLATLLPAGGAQGSTGAATLPPEATAWMAQLRIARLLPRDYVLRPRAAGIVYGSNNAVVDDVVDDELTMPVALLDAEDRTRGLAAVAAVEAAENAVRALGVLARHLREAAGGDGVGARDRAQELGFAALDTHFRRWVSALGPDRDLVDAEAAWHRRVRREIRDLADEFLAGATPAAWRGRTVNNRHLDVGRAEGIFTHALAVAVPRAHSAAAAEPPAA